MKFRVTAKKTIARINLLAKRKVKYGTKQFSIDQRYKLGFVDINPTHGLPEQF